MRDLGYHEATLGGVQPYSTSREQSESDTIDPRQVFEQAEDSFTTTDGLWNHLLPFNASHDEYGACIDHSCADGNGFSRLCSSVFVAGRGGLESMSNNYVRYNDEGTFGVCRGTQTINSPAQPVNAIADDGMFPLTYSDVGNQTFKDSVYPMPNSSSDRARLPYQDLFDDDWTPFPDNFTFGDDYGASLSTYNISDEIEAFAQRAQDNFAMMATDQIAQTQSARSDLTLAVPSGGAMSSQHMLGQTVGVGEYAAHRAEPLSYKEEETGEGPVDNTLLAYGYESNFGWMKDM